MLRVELRAQIDGKWSTVGEWHGVPPLVGEYVDATLFLDELKIKYEVKRFRVTERRWWSTRDMVGGGCICIMEAV